MKKISTLLALLFPVLSFAGGGQLGNGADAVVCTKGFQTTAELLDIYEARALLQKDWAYNYEGGTAIELSAMWGVEKILSKLDTILPVKSKRLREYMSTFLDEANFLSGVELTDIPDSMQVALPGNCKLAQLVIQSPNPQFGQKRYTINKDLWDLMSPHNRMGMVLHEIIYRDQMDLGHQDSRWTRYFNAMLFSKTIDTMTPQEVNNLLRQGSLSTFKHNGFELLGAANANQPFYQIVGALPGSTAPAGIIEGRYNLKEDRALDYTTGTGGTVFGISTSRGYGLELNQDGSIATAYLQDGRVSPTVTLVGKNYDSDFQGIIVTGVDDHGNISFRPYSTHAVVQFANGPKAESKSIGGIKLGISTEDLLASFGCTNSTCDWLNISYANGQGTAEYISFTYAGSNIVQLVSMNNRFMYSIPKGVDKNLFPYQPDHFKMDFTPTGDFSFKFSLQGRNNPIQLVKKDGSIVTIEVKKDYLLVFDRDGYLINVTP